MLRILGRQNATFCPKVGEMGVGQAGVGKQVSICLVRRVCSLDYTYCVGKKFIAALIPYKVFGLLTASSQRLEEVKARKGGYFLKSFCV